ncbi:hypothetical protein [Anatilimnocola floriformis]|uniref:hypothetical protein n=1 Tax=Anatilimnocola floriformis TaxID=2948575 RepID=UPI0020C51B81|nr:hypothetical protein [Anatilimnocola floriformis]
MNAPAATIAAPQIRYTVSDLLKYTTVCGVLLAAHPLTGVGAAVLLIAMALALGARVGLLAAALLMAAFLAAASADGSREFCTLLLGCSVLGWYRFERWRTDLKTSETTESPR